MIKKQQREEISVKINYENLWPVCDLCKVKKLGKQEFYISKSFTSYLFCLHFCQGRGIYVLDMFLLLYNMFLPLLLVNSVLVSDFPLTCIDVIKHLLLILVLYLSCIK